MALIDQPDKAMRLARAIASDIALYNEAKIKAAIVDDSFFVRLAPELDEGRALYASRVVPELDPDAQLFWQAVVNVVVRAQGHLPAKIW